MESIIFWDVTAEDDTLHNHRCENLKSYIIYKCTHHSLQEREQAKKK
jgi:hypothetical protein